MKPLAPVQRIKARLREFPASLRATYALAMSGRSRKAAVRSMCIMCMGMTAAEVRRCTDPACPLYPYRMGKTTSTRTKQKGGKDASQEEATTGT